MLEHRSPFRTLSQSQLEIWIEQARVYSQAGELPQYIPYLAEVNPHLCAIAIQGIDGQVLTAGDDHQSFPLMSVIKPFVLLFLLEQFGTEAVFEKVGMEASSQAFNSLPQIEVNQGKPTNPMLNSGAMTLAAMLVGKDAQTRCENFCHWLNHRSHAKLKLDQQVLDSVRSRYNHRNQQIIELLCQFGYIEDGEIALDTYNQICCLAGTVGDLAQLGMLLTRSIPTIQHTHQRIVKAIMTTCGMYQSSGSFAARIGLPSKSGVSGAILSVVPKQGAIACYSPALDKVGNSVASLYLLEQLHQTLDLGLF